ncbi:MAG: polymerase sigma-70 factor, subfamily [Mucilaginibacter sp.]|nr:polymerase sigma-70 factor, subfamily [Mucilaginibacter sp.]
MNAHNSFTDLELTDLLKSGSQSAFTEIYDRYSGLLYIFACKTVKDEDLAEDLVQEIFIYLWDKRQTITFNSSLSSYLYTALRYRFFDLVDKQKVRSDYVQAFQLFIEKGEYQTDNYIIEKELTAIINKEINNLPAKMREIFLLSRKENLDNKEIAARLEISEKTVKNQLSMALKTLRVKLGLLTFIFLLLNH